MFKKIMFIWFKILLKVSISEYMGILEGKLAIKVLKTYPSLKKKSYCGNYFWSKE